MGSTLIANDNSLVAMPDLKPSIVVMRNQASMIPRYRCDDELATYNIKLCKIAAYIKLTE